MFRCGCERMMAGGGGGYMFAAELCGPGREMEAGQGRKTTGAAEEPVPRGCVDSCSRRCWP
jgi:hypothetical protein